ncbi:MAG: RagB/SusD family nutrient uptake outer membrane protein [Muribaculaceae bacterium]|nr:RagB/SusD family nutrient uptake outer membrane protein [Muribaculaceae bacterium]
MKIFSKYFVGLALAGTLSLSSCVNDLDVPVKDPNQETIDKLIKENPQGTLHQIIAEIYQGLSTAGYGGAGSTILGLAGDAGATAFPRQLFFLEEIPADGYSWLQFADAGMYEMVTMNFAPDNGIMYTAYSRLYTEIALCNEAIRTIESNRGAFGEALNAEMDEYIRQAKIVRSYAYFYAISQFGDAGYCDETSPSGAAPEQTPRAELYNKVVATLEEVSAEYGDNYVAPAYGYVGKEAADALLSRFYLNAQAFTGTPAYDKCWNISQKIINHHKGTGFNETGLAYNYISLFGANNNEYAPQGSRENEIIWTIPQDGNNLQSYGGSTFYVGACQGAFDDINVNNSNLNSSWTCMVARQQLSELMNFDADGNATDLRAELWMTSKDGLAIDNVTISGSAGFGKGYAPLKYSNFAFDKDGNIDMSISPSASNAFCDADWTVIRLAEIYLNAAEANIAGNAGNAADALQYVNNVRERAGVEPWTASQMTLANILDERGRELYGENIRRTDLVRHGKFAGSAYVWNWKGGVQKGAATDTKYNLYPIPTKVISFQGYKQNPGY